VTERNECLQPAMAEKRCHPSRIAA
jgi:hypothetical protein